MSSSELKNQLATKAANPPVAKSPEQTVADYLKKMAPEIQRALPSHMDADRLARIALTAIRTNPKLLQCNIHSLMGAVMMASQLGLEPGVLGQCDIIPYGREAQFQIGYRGMILLARRSGEVQTITVREVYMNDDFDMNYGDDESIKHKPWFMLEGVDDKGILRGLYMIVRNYNKEIIYRDFMLIPEIEQRRKRSKAANSGPWVTDYIEMCKKTVIRANFKWLPISIEVIRQVEGMDGKIKAEIREDMAEAPELELDTEQAEEAEYMEVANA